MNKIQNYECYLTKMSKTFFDKAWFMSHLPESIDTIIDFGCADGSFMKFLKNNCPSFKYIGIDNSPYFKDLTIKNGFECYKSLKDVDVNIDPNKTCLILSSVLHEIYSYADVDEFWKRINDLHPEYIAIRDMLGIYDKILYRYDARRIEKIFEETFNKQYEEFKNVWKTFNNPITIIHFLLKYIYNNENWKREVKENYLPINKDIIYNKINEFNYNIEFEEYYKLPYLVNRWNVDFGANKDFHFLNEFIKNMTSHFKMLLKANE